MTGERDPSEGFRTMVRDTVTGALDAPGGVTETLRAIRDLATDPTISDEERGRRLWEWYADGPDAPERLLPAR